MELPSLIKRPLTLILAVFFSLMVLVYRPLFLGMAILERDVLRWIIPARAVLRAAMVRGEIPVWNSLEGIGLPIFSDPLYGPFYPPTVLTLPGPLVETSMLFMFAHVLLGGVGAILLARRLKVGFVAALTAGFAWALSGYVSAEWNTGIRLISTAWLPWSALAWLYLSRKCEEHAPRWWCAVGVATFPAAMTFLAGEVFLGIISAAFGFLVGLSELNVRNRGSLVRHAIAFASALGLSASAGALALLPSALIASTTERAAPLVPFLANGYSLRWGRIIDLFVANGLGQAWTEYTAEASPLTHGPILNVSLYLGAATLTLALSARFKQHLPRVFLGLVVFFFVMALGYATPVFPLVRWIVRPLSYMRSTEKYLACVVPLVTSLAALGFQRIVEDRDLPWRRICVFAGLLLGYAALTPVLYPEHIAPIVRNGCLRSALIVLAVLGLARGLRARSNHLAVALAALVFADCAQHERDLHLYFPIETALRPPLALAEVAVPGYTGAYGPVRVYRAPSVNTATEGLVVAPGRLLTVDTLQENTSNLFGVAVLPGYDAALPRTITRLLSSHRLDALRLLSVDYVLMAAPAQGPSGDRPGLTRVNTAIPGTVLYHLDTRLPRVFLAGSVQRMRGDELEHFILHPDVVAGRTALHSSSLAFTPTPPAPAVPCDPEVYTQGRVGVRCVAEHPSLAVFVEQYTIGWSATVDGRPAPVVQANQLHLGVPVPAGTHRVRLTYTPPGLWVGMGLTVVSFIAMTLASLALVRVRLRGRQISINAV